MIGIEMLLSFLGGVVVGFAMAHALRAP